MASFLLYDSASGYALFERLETEEVGAALDAVQKSVNELSRFSKQVTLKAFLPFTSAEGALANINAVTEGEVTDDLRTFLEQNLPKAKPGKKSKFSLGVHEPRIGNVLQETMGFRCVSDDTVLELLRGCRQHFTRFVKGMDEGDLQQAQLGLAHSFSRSCVKYDVNRADNMIIQAVALLDTLDKDLNTFIMRVREWYSLHFPELAKVVSDNYLYCRVVLAVGDKAQLSDESLPKVAEALAGDEEKAQEVLDAARMSMGPTVSPIDLINIERFATRVIKLSEYRKQLHEYLLARMHTCAPNLTALIGERVGARLLAHAGSLTSLAKYPASTVQILGAEKALFRALKTKGNTPKYGLIFHSTFIGRAAPKNKGRISRYLANKCSIASRIDAFSDEPTEAYGNALRAQVEERLEFYKTGKTPSKNADAMAAARKEAGGDAGDDSDADMEPATPKKKEKKGKKEKKSEKKKSAKKRKRSSDDDDDDAAAAEDAGSDGASEHKKKKKKKSKK